MLLPRTSVARACCNMSCCEFWPQIRDACNLSLLPAEQRRNTGNLARPHNQQSAAVQRKQSQVGSGEIDGAAGTPLPRNSIPARHVPQHCVILPASCKITAEPACVHMWVCTSQSITCADSLKGLAGSGNTPCLAAKDLVVMDHVVNSHITTRVTMMYTVTAQPLRPSDPD